MIFSSSLIFSSYFMVYMCVAFLLFILHVVCHAFWICGLMFIDLENSQPLSLQLLLLDHVLSIPNWMVWQFTFYDFSLLFSLYLMLFSIYLSCQPGAFLWICLLIQKFLQYLWLISSSYAFLVGQFLMSIIFVEFGSHCLSFICPFLFQFLSIRQGFFKKIEVWFEAQEWYYLFPKRIHADILRALSVGISPYSNYD